MEISSFPRRGPNEGHRTIVERVQAIDDCILQLHVFRVAHWHWRSALRGTGSLESWRNVHIEFSVCPTRVDGKEYMKLQGFNS